MAAYFLDSSAVVKRYMVELGSPWVQQLFNPPRANYISISAICCVEVVAAITRRVRGGGLDPVTASRVIRTFRLELPTDFVPVNMTQAVLDRAMDLAERHGLRGYDSVQLAAALTAHPAARRTGARFAFVSSDRELNAAAVAEGLTVEDPNNHP